MDLSEFLRRYRKSKKLSVRRFAEMLDVSRFRLEKWEKDIHPNYEDAAKIRKYFRVSNIQNLSEEVLNSFEPENPDAEKEELIRLKDQIIEEKEKRIQTLEETINIMREAYGYGVKKKG